MCCSTTLEIVKQILLGTTKGLLIMENQGGRWIIVHRHFLGLPVSMIHRELGSDSWWVALSIKHWGPKLYRSDDGGNSFHEVNCPKYPESAIVKKDKPATLKLIWSMSSSNSRLWIGTEPGGLFTSNDQGENWTLVDSLWNHPSRLEHWFGGGRNDAGIHSICIHPTEEDHIYIGVSCAGVFETRDGGLTWTPKNVGLRADYLPDPFVEVGHDPHSMAICRSATNVIWQQNHCGVFRSIDNGETWKDVTSADNYGRYGFALSIDPANPLRAWIIPAESDEKRIAKDGNLVVCYTEDGGESWRQFKQGLPQQDCFDLVFRHAFDRSDTILVFGTTTGNLYLSEDDGRSWSMLNSNLPPIHVVQIHPL